ncbi:MAG TPA: hypothetical protein VEZ89_01765 [Rubrivivax sp.]|nr:hypothetical protein [Rubrivivax sp.]
MRVTITWDRRDQPAANLSVPVDSGRPDLLLLRIRLHGDEGARKAFYSRLQLRVLQRGLVAAVMRHGVAVVPVDRALTERDRGLLLAWAITQPEILRIDVVQRVQEIADRQSPGRRRRALPAGRQGVRR